MKVTVTGPDLAGSHVVAERRDDGSLVLEPERELLSEVAETDGQVFRDEEFIAHLERVAAAEETCRPTRATRRRPPPALRTRRA